MSSSDRIIRAAELGFAPPTPAPCPAVPASSCDAGQLLVGRSPRRHVAAIVAPASAPQPAADEAVALPGQPDLAAELAAARDRGHAEGRELARRELEERLAAVGAFAEQLEATAPHEAGVIARVVVDLSLAIAARILDREVAEDPALLAGVIERALRTVNGSPEAHVYLNPETVDAVREAWESTHGSAYLGKRWVFEPDRRQPPGGCTIRHEHGFVETGLEAQLEEIRLVLDRTIPGLARRALEAEGAA